MPNYLTHFRYLGRLVGKALIGGTDSFELWNFEVSFAKSFLKHILDRPLYVRDLEELDPKLCQSLEWILENELETELGVFFT